MRRPGATERAGLRKPLRTLVVRRAARLPGESGPKGHVKIGMVTLACVLGRTGVRHCKREGDAATPAARMRLLYGFFRPDRMARPPCRVPLRPLPRDLGWCDDPAVSTYNRPGPLPMRSSHETMWRADELYDVVFVLDYNLNPRRAGRGSAIFLHCAKGAGGAGTAGLRPTLGCVALRPDDMRRLIGRLASDVCLVVV